MATGAPKKGRFAKKRRFAATFSSIAGLSPILLICADLAIATVPAAAQSFSLGGFGIAGGLGALGLFHHGFGGGYGGGGRGLGPPGFMFHGGLGSAGRRFEGRSSWGQSGGQSQFRQRSPFGTYGREQRSSPHWPGNSAGS